MLHRKHNYRHPLCVHQSKPSTIYSLIDNTLSVPLNVAEHTDKEAAIRQRELEQEAYPLVVRGLQTESHTHVHRHAMESEDIGAC